MEDWLRWLLKATNVRRLFLGLIFSLSSLCLDAHLLSVGWVEEFQLLGGTLRPFRPNNLHEFSSARTGGSSGSCLSTSLCAGSIRLYGGAEVKVGNKSFFNFHRRKLIERIFLRFLFR